MDIPRSSYFPATSTNPKQPSSTPPSVEPGSSGPVMGVVAYSSTFSGHSVPPIPERCVTKLVWSSFPIRTCRFSRTTTKRIRRCLANPRQSCSRLAWVTCRLDAGSFTTRSPSRAAADSGAHSSAEVAVPAGPRTRQCCAVERPTDDACAAVLASKASLSDSSKLAVSRPGKAARSAASPRPLHPLDGTSAGASSARWSLSHARCQWWPSSPAPKVL
mmetsp:Transcript_27706/g.49463  ORF Transcript_27706/g.49463 Transcript_27706/m.49463 type:complete len:217 (-) Transcript_27706:166-816(-)